jgi:hypothetical protein
VGSDSSAEACVKGFEIVPGLLELVQAVGLAPKSCSSGLRAGACELVMEALAGERKISRSVTGSYAKARHESSSGQGSKGFDPFGGISA